MSAHLSDQLDAVATAELVARGEASPTDVVSAALARIDERDGALNAVIHRRDDRALSEAVDPPAGPLRGVPVLVKDIVASMADEPYHAGMRFLAERAYRAEVDSYFVRRLRAAGAVIVGRTNTPELASSFMCEPDAYGPTRNPYALDRSTGGSSGGSAAAVASGMVPVAHGNDMGGSIRVPASACGLVGLKPSRARTSIGPSFGELWGPLTHEHVLTRTVRDSALLLDVVNGAWPGDPYTAPPPARPYATEAVTDPAALRIGVFRAEAIHSTAVHRACGDAVDAAARWLEALGHHVGEAWPDALGDTDVSSAAVPLFAAAIARDLDRVGALVGAEVTSGDVEPGTWFLAELGRAMAAPALLAALDGLWAWTRRAVAWWTPVDADERGWDVLVTPTMPVPPIPLGHRDDPAHVLSLGAFTQPWNITGQPAISLPLGLDADGVPVGVQLVAAPWREDVLLQVAGQLERAGAFVHPPT